MKQFYRNLKKFCAIIILIGSPLQTPVLFAENIVPVPTQYKFIEELEQSAACPEMCDQRHVVLPDPVIQEFIVDFVEHAINNNLPDLIPDCLKRCYIRLKSDYDTLHYDDVKESLPVLINILTRAPRPSSKPTANNNLVVGPGTCNLNTVIGLLRNLQCSLDQCCADLQADFDLTFSLIQNIDCLASFTFPDFNVSVTVDLSGVFTALDACCNDIINTVTECCQDIQQDFDFTWTILADIKQTLTECCADLKATITSNNLTIIDTLTECCATLEQDFNFTWTILADIKETLTECCQDIQQDFDFTWTILADIKQTLTECCADLKATITSNNSTIIDTLTECCATLEQDFAFTWTILADLKDSQTNCCADISRDFNFTWTILADIKETLTECCQDIQQDFDFTWTILADIKQTLTECCADIQADISGIFTAIADLRVTVTVDNSEIIDTLTTCCADISRDFNFTWTILADIKETLTECCQDIQQDFDFTWTILADIKETLTECCADIIDTITSNNSTIIDTLTECCATLEQDFAFTWTILADLKDSQTNCCADISRDFNFTWTILADIKETLTECCQDIQQDFDFTWTILADIKETLTECCADLKATITSNNSTIIDTLTECCATLEQDFAFTWTILADLKDSQTNCCADISRDFNFTWTILADIKETLTECCQDIQQDFDFTWTILADIKETLTECCQDLKQDFAFTWTILADIEADITGIFTVLNDIQIDLSPVFTVLADIKETLTECCQELKQDFAFTWTILADIEADITGIFTVLNDIQVDLSPVFTVLADIKETLTECCQDLKQDFAFTWTILDFISQKIDEDIDIAQDTFLTLSRLFCMPFFITQEDVGTTGYTITAPGNYRLAEDIEYAGITNPAITIASANVTLDMSCYSLRYVGVTAGIDGVQVTSGTKDNITITGGSIEDFTGDGIEVGNTITRLKILNTRIQSATNRGIALIGTTSAGQIRQVKIDNVQIFNSSTGTSGTATLQLDFCNDLQLTNCRVNENGATGHNLSVVSLTNCTNVFAENIEAVNNTADQLFVYALDTTVNSSFRKCAAQDNTATGANAGRGFSLVSNSDRNQFLDCSVVDFLGADAVDAFFTTTGCDNNYYNNCRALSNQTTGAGTGVIHGFNVINNTGNVLENCLASNNTAPNSTVTFANIGANGFVLNTVTNSSLINCQAYDNTTGGSSTSVGIRIFNGSDNFVKDCESARHTRGFRLDPSQGVAHVFTKNFSTQNTIQYSGFPGGSSQIGGDITNINGSLTIPWTNAGITG